MGFGCGLVKLLIVWVFIRSCSDDSAKCVVFCGCCVCANAYQRLYSGK